MTLEIVRHIGDPLPSNVTRCNAPRPLYGTRAWEGDWCCGRHWADIDDNDPNRDWCLAENESLKAVQIIMVSETDVIAWAHEDYTRMMGGDPWPEWAGDGYAIEHWIQSGRPDPAIQTRMEVTP